MQVTNQKDIIERMMSVCGASIDAELASYLGVSSSQVIAWKNAKNPPFKACFQMYLKTGVTMEWLITGNNPANPGGNAQANAENNTESDKQAFIARYCETFNAGQAMEIVKLGEGASLSEVRRLGIMLYKAIQREPSFKPVSNLVLAPIFDNPSEQKAESSTL
ncbi:helix-turn-helix domain-containing protein [Paraneptunicella aestuarii]|uniref:helix-turn-helix domain-containing protein n=1 Tax=Paraneptunicella aestuarii TaxID=2831148 RepID=UPI001E427E88|nr:helix-turn-helix domain-containing protein [Paraneptunicella aestuarii]UAA40140.1 helix-turn-helix domain-containing protein [Paraneptunicella aestuarii]